MKRALQRCARRLSADAARARAARRLPERAEDVKRQQSLLLAWLDKRDDSGFRGRFMSGSREHDLEGLVNHYTSPALARALRQREETLATIAAALCTPEYDPDKKSSSSKLGEPSPAFLRDFREARELLMPYAELPAPQPHFSKGSASWDDALEGAAKSPPTSEQQESYVLPDYREGGLFHPAVLKRLRKRLNRLPREVSSRARKRASVILPLCHVDGVPSVLFTQRSHNLSRFRGQICFPGGMIDDSDPSVEYAGLRELHEEVGIAPAQVEVLGILRCDWSEITSITGVAVTPIVGYLGALEELDVSPNPAEVTGHFTVPVDTILDKDNWIVRKYSPPVFREPDAPKDQTIWGLTGYILHRFMRLLPSVVFDNHISEAATFGDHEDAVVGNSFP